MAIAATLMPACQKHSDGPQNNGSQTQPQTPPQSPKRVITNGGGDDDGPIIIHIVKNKSQQAVANASVVMTDDSDSLELATNESGSCTFTLPHFGSWHLKINHTGYQPADTVLYLADSLRVKTSILEDQ